MVASARRHRYTLTDYLAVEEMSQVRHEFLEGEIFAMAGGTPEHAALAAAVVVLLGNALRGGACRPYSSDLRLRVPVTGLATYPDAAVICGDPERDPTSPTHVTNPTVIVEVLSSSTEEYDRGEKREHYARLDSLREYVLVSQSARRVEVYSRDGADWRHRVHAAGETVELPAIDARLDVDELYEMAGLRFV